MSFQGPASAKYPFVIRCKNCKEHIPAPVITMPDAWIIAECPLCHDKRRYLAAEIFDGKLSHKLAGKRLAQVIPIEAGRR
jgi:hypothetical protein